jgi:hypothetical protein
VTQRDLAQQRFVLLVGQSGGHVGLNKTRCHTVDRDLPAAQLARQRLAAQTAAIEQRNDRRVLEKELPGGHPRAHGVDIDHQIVASPHAASSARGWCIHSGAL